MFPGHGAGSACGKNLSTDTSSTIGEQRRSDYALATPTEEAFVAAVTSGQSVAPMYFAFASHRNREAHAMLDERAPVPAFDLARVDEAVRAGAVLLDTRDPDPFATAHLAGALNVGLGGRFAEVAGQIVPSDADLVLVCEPGTEIEARNRLARIGFDRVLGHLDGGIVAAGPDRLRSAGRIGADFVAASA